jgi:hypothetical protein
MSWRRMGDLRCSSTILDLCTYEGEWPTSRFGHSTPGEGGFSVHWIGGWVGPRADGGHFGVQVPTLSSHMLIWTHTYPTLICTSVSHLMWELFLALTQWQFVREDLVCWWKPLQFLVMHFLDTKVLVNLLNSSPFQQWYFLSCSSPSIIRMIKSRRMRWDGISQARGRRGIHIQFWWEIDR